MKYLLLLITVLGLFACNDEGDSSTHEQQWSSDGKDSVVYVHYKDDNGNWVDFYMQYVLFNSLFNSGGYSACYNHYHSNPTHYYSNNYYTNYSPRPSSDRSSTNDRVPVKSYSSPSRSNWSSSSSASSKSHSSPSRSSSSSSYSSPSRSSGSSYSSPSRSYSSPSRSYSSPSRSYSSPSRH
jgi:hypothetical protein